MAADTASNDTRRPTSNNYEYEVEGVEGDGLPEYTIRITQSDDASFVGKKATIISLGADLAYFSDQKASTKK